MIIREKKTGRHSQDHKKNQLIQQLTKLTFTRNQESIPIQL